MSSRVSSRYLLKRTGLSVFTIWIILTLLFLLLKAMPGDYASILLAQSLGSGDIEALRQQFGLDKPWWVQYLRWVQNYLMLNFGMSYTKGEPVANILLRRLPRTLVLFGTAFLLNYTFGILTGINFGWHRGGKVDKTGFLTGLTLYSIPFFWLAWLLLLLLSYEGFGVAWFPSGHMLPAFQSAFTSTELIIGTLTHMFIPAASLAVVGWGGSMLVMRTSMQEVLDKHYIEIARAKGLAPATVKYKHAGRNALIPVATQAIVGIAFMIDGSVVVETVFSWPGIGALLVTAIMDRDLPVALASFFMLGVIIVLMRLLTDVVYTYLDPRIKFGESQ